MFNNPFRLIAYASFSLVFLLLLMFTNWNRDMIVLVSFFIAIAVILLFIFKTRGLKKLKMALIVFVYISVPTFGLMFSGVLNGIPSPWNGIVLAIIVGFSVIASIFTIVKLDLIEIVNVDGDLYLK